MKKNATPPAPILIHCEGSGSKGHAFIIRTLALCPMCGRAFHVDADMVVPHHMREDILAQLLRGDYD